MKNSARCKYSRTARSISFYGCTFILLSTLISVTRFEIYANTSLSLNCLRIRLYALSPEIALTATLFIKYRSTNTQRISCHLIVIRTQFRFRNSFQQSHFQRLLLQSNGFDAKCISDPFQLFSIKYACKTACVFYCHKTF